MPDNLIYFLILLIPLFWILCVYLVKKLNPLQTTTKFHVDVFKSPQTFSFQLLGIAIPALSGLAGYFITKQPDQSLIFLKATIIVFTTVLVVSIWSVMAITSRFQTNGNIEITLPRDYKYLIANALMYLYILLGFVYLSFFFFLELNIHPKNEEPKPASYERSVLERVEKNFLRSTLKVNVIEFSIDTPTHEITLSLSEKNKRYEITNQIRKNEDE